MLTLMNIHSSDTEEINTFTKKDQIQYRSFITSLLHACTRMVPRSIWQVKILGLPWKNFFPRDESWHLAWHFTTRVLAFPRHVSFPQDVDFHVTSHGIYTQRA